MKAVMKVEPGYDKMLLKTIPELEVQKNQVKIKLKILIISTMKNCRIQKSLKLPKF